MEETLNESTTESTSAANTEAENGESPIADGGNPITDSGSSMQSPFDQLLQFEEFDSLGDILGDVDPSDNPFAGGVAPSGDVVPSADGSDAPEDSSSDSLDSSDPDTNANPLASSDNATNDTAEGFEGMLSGEGGSMMNADFGGTDTGAGNTDNGNGNNFVGDSEGNSGSNNQADGNGNWFYGNDNQTNGNGNWNFGNGNQVEGNGNWNLNEESASSNPTSEGGNNPLADGNSQSGGAESGIPADAFGGNNPAFAGGSSIPAPVGGEISDTAENPTGNRNTVSGNGNWSLGDNNEVSGNGNRPSGDNNSISGNGNRLTGDNNNIEGNRFESDADGLNAVGNGDRYLVENEDGSTTLVSDESAGDSNYDYSGVVEASADSEDESAGQNVGNRVYASSIENTDSASDNSNADVTGGENSFDGGSDAEANTGEENSFDGGSDAEANTGGENSFDGGSDAEANTGGENSFDGGSDAEANTGGENSLGGDSNSNANPDYEYDFSTFEPSGEGDESSTMNGGENPFGDGSDAGGEGEGNPFGGGSDAEANAGESDPNELIRQSPFGVLLDIPGIDGVEDIFGNVGGAGGQMSGGDNPFAGGASDGGGDSAGGGNPFAGGAGGQMSGGGNPFGGGDSAGGGNPFAGGAGGGNSDIPAMNASQNGAAPESISDSNYEYEYDFGTFENSQPSDAGASAGGQMSGGGNPFGGGADSDSSGGENPFANFNPLEDGNPFVEGDEPDVAFGGAGEDNSSSDDAGDAQMIDGATDESSPFGDDADSSSLPEQGDGTTNLIDETDLENPAGEAPVFDAENSGIKLPNGATINPFNEAGEFDLSIATPVIDEDGSTVGELDLSFPEYVEDYFSSVFNLDEVQEFNSNDESAISEIQDDFDSLFGVGAPVLGEDNVLQFSGGFGIDISGIMNDSADLSDSGDSDI